MSSKDTNNTKIGNRSSINSDTSSNFHVCVRIRPTSNNSFYSQGHLEGQKYIREGPENSILLVQPNSTQGDKMFIYDEVFNQYSRTIDIFEKVVKPNLLESLFKGFSHTILVYGMTGSGKTFTMFGDNYEEITQMQMMKMGNQREVVSNNYDLRVSMNTEFNETDGPLKKGEFEGGVSNDSKGGLVSEIVKLIINKQQQQGGKTKLRMSYLEIYNESVRDLLSSENTAENLIILEDPDKGVVCPLLSEREINSLSQISILVKQGNNRRVMASTKLNQFSSRSHAIIQLSLEIEIENDGKVTTLFTPKLYLVDLAGSERVAATESKGQRLKEGANINRSLLSLGNCITVLSSQVSKGTKHIPYRDSKLTRLLKESLGGNAKTLFIGCVTPAFRFVEETINTLKYSQRAKNIKKEVYENVKRIHNEIERKEQMKEMQAEIENLKELLEHQPIVGDLDEGMEWALEGTENEEMRRRLDGLENKIVPDLEVIRSEEYRNHKELFQERFAKLSESFEDILFRNRELEFNLGEFVQSREQNERLVHDIMDTINPSSLTQKEMKYRLDRVNTLRSMIKHNEEVIIKLQRELGENEVMKTEIKRELESLYEVKFIKECQQLTNFQLYSTFEQEKKNLKLQIESLLTEKQIQREEDIRKEQQIIKLREEIMYIKKKANLCEAQLQQNQEIKKNKSRGRAKCQLNLRSSMQIAGQKNTPRNTSQTNVASKYMQFQTFVPSTNISVNTVRGKSANLRQSMYTNTSQNQKSEIVDPFAPLVHSMTDVFTAKPHFNQKTDANIPFRKRNDNMIEPHSPQTKEFEEYRRKEQIIESQLKNVQKSSSSFKNTQSSSPLFNDICNMNYQNFVPSNRLSNNNQFKSSLKSSFIDLASNHSNDYKQPANYVDNQVDNSSNDADMPMNNYVDPQHDPLLNRRSELTHQQYQKIFEKEQFNNSPYNTDNYQTSETSVINSQLISPKAIQKVRYTQPMCNVLSPSTSYSTQQSKNLSKHHSKNPSYHSFDEKNNGNSSTLQKGQSGASSLIIETQQELPPNVNVISSIQKSDIPLQVTKQPKQYNITINSTKNISNQYQLNFQNELLNPITSSTSSQLYCSNPIQQVKNKQVNFNQSVGLHGLSRNIEVYPANPIKNPQSPQITSSSRVVNSLKTQSPNFMNLQTEPSPLISNEYNKSPSSKSNNNKINRIQTLNPSEKSKNSSEFISPICIDPKTSPGHGFSVDTHNPIFQSSKNPVYSSFSDSPSKDEQNKLKPKIPQPNFNSFVQNKAIYGTINSQLQEQQTLSYSDINQTTPLQLSKQFTEIEQVYQIPQSKQVQLSQQQRIMNVPTAAITLLFDHK